VINIHDVVLAQQFVDRVVGLRAGKLVFDGPPSGLNEKTLTDIYGEEDWSAAAPDQEESDEPEASTSDLLKPIGQGSHP
jgi:phosphonate transport system ATP-binding protein